MTFPTSDRAVAIRIIRTDDPKVAGSTHKHSGCERCLAK